MLNALRKRLERDEDGFTLIELMVVVLIIAILLAIAIPTFLGARERAQNRAAQSDIRNALTAEKTFYTDEQEYTADVAAGGELEQIEPSLSYAAAGTTDDVGVVLGGALAAGDNLAVCLSKESASGAEFSVLDVAVGPNAGTFFYEDLTCNGEDGLTAGGPTGETNGW